MKWFITILIISFCSISHAQDPIVDQILPSGDDDLNYDDLYDNLSQLTTNPLNLNRTTTEELLSLGILSPQQANDIVEYRRLCGDLLEVYELQSIASLDLSTINKLRPFVTARPSLPGKKFLDRIRSQNATYLLARYERTLERAEAYRSVDTSSRYPGDPGRIYTRFRTTSAGDLSAGFTAEKDAGEQFQWTKSIRGFDFYSAHLQLINKGPIINMIAGDYTAQFGQGLTLGGGFGIGKGSETITTLRRSSTGFMPYTSANEAGFFRGGAVSLSLPANIVVHVFGSSLARDASSNDGSLAVLQSGKHRTATELLNRHRMNEKNFGGVIEYKGGSLEAGVIVHRTQFSDSIRKRPTVYNGFDFSGIANSNLGIFANYSLHNVAFFGEASHTLNRGSGAVAGILASINRNVDVSLLMRSYDRNFITFYSNAISENTMPKNESGIYWGWKHSINRKLSYTAYADLFIFPWLKFRSYRPADGTETLVRLNYRQSKACEFFIQLREERKERNVASEYPSYQTSTARRRNLAIGSYLLSGDLSLRSRIQWSSFHQSSATHGFAVAFDAGYEWNRLSFNGRFAIFDTDDFDNRQYMNERDVLMAFSFPAYYGQGTRTYLVGRYQPAPWLDFWLKIARTKYFNELSSGSGGDTIDGNMRHDIKVEVVFRPP